MLPQGPYNFNQNEKDMLKFWLDNNYYKPEYNPVDDRVMTIEEMKKDPRDPWCLICPPPNAYGRPHLGNISGYAYQDAMARYARMQGKKVLMIPGKDHAGLEGEGVFVREVLEPKKIYKFSLSREEFYKMIWDFNMQNKELALKDEQAIGLSADFDRDIFTLDPKIVTTVLSTFVEMYKEKMIYKGVRIINWDPKARSAIADNQCVREERDGKLYFIKYPLIEKRVWRINFYKSDILERIQNGSKTIETRALNPEEKDRYFGDIKTGDLIICFDKSENNKPSLYKKVKKVEIFKNMQDIFEHIDHQNVFGKKYKSKEELAASYAELATDYDKKIDQNGLVAITLEDLQDKDFITVATTRPETMFGDTAVAVNPEDERYKDMIGKKVIIPLTDTLIPIITSPRVEKEYGTGALKITPAHAPDDYQIMQEWNATNPKSQITYVNIIDKGLLLVGPVPAKYNSRKYKEALPEIIEDLKTQGLLEKEETIKQNVLIAERTKALVEPMISSQWFLDIEKIKQPVIDMVKKGEVKIHPEYMEAKFYHWMENLRDWAISRSLWWGYRMPVWYAGAIEERVDDNGKVEAWINLSAPGGSVKGGSEILDPTNENHMKVQLESPGEGWIQEESVLDTWFSSGQWPYATLMAYDLMDTFYPTDVLGTASDILENWVSRMMMFSYFKFKKKPFKDVYLYGLVQGKDGQKMSKSRKNVIPLDEAGEKYGLDALRMVYFYQNSAGASYSLTYDKLQNFRNFNNKIWNASKLVLMHLENLDEFEFQKEDLKLELSKKIVEHVAELKKLVTKNIDTFEFGLATFNLYHEFWHTFCDIQLEEAKKYLNTVKNKETGEIISEPKSEEKIEITKILIFTLKEYLKMMHPFIPFITERVWRELPKDKSDHNSLMYTRW